MKAMIFAAGKGERLKPITSRMPKALVEVNGKPLLQRVIERLISFGVNEIIINVCYFAEQIMDFVKARDSFGIRIEFSDEREKLLDTGGGLKKAAWFFDEPSPFLLHNVDIITNLDFNRMLEFHKTHNALATLAVRRRDSSRRLLFNAEQKLCGWENEKIGERILIRDSLDALKPLAFSGVQIVSPSIFNMMPARDVFSIIELYLNLAAGNKILAFRHDSDYWFDVGTPEKLKEAEDFLKRKERK